MGILQVVFVGALAVFGYGIYSIVSRPAPKFDLDAYGYFGKGDAKPDDKTIKPFKIEVPDAVLEDLKNRLNSSRIGHEQLEDVKTFEYGFNLKTLLAYKDHWLNKYDWRKHEAELNAFPQFKTQIEGLEIHFLHVKPQAKKYKKVSPLLIVHGWPGNVYEFYKIIPLLTDPQAYGIQSDSAFEVVAPSIPGYGWSEAAHKQGLNCATTARIFNKLMTERLNHKKFLAQGGDWGSLVVSHLARFFPQSVHAIHLNMIFSSLNNPVSLFKSIVGSIFPSLVFSDPRSASHSLLKDLGSFMSESGYFHIQATKPDTVGTSLNDSPLGLLAYIGEKFSTWTNNLYINMEDGGIEKKFTKDEIISIVMVYWINQNIVSSQRYYKENFLTAELQSAGNIYVSTPVGYAAFPNDLVAPAPLELARVTFNITQYTPMNDGGHFAAFEMPKQLARDIFKFAYKWVPNFV